ncbi:MAG: FliA/WhiG family RNA polymerase sigma factor, partial [Verrucomicrobiota bacterium]
HITKDDLVSSGVLGLMDAITRYDPSRGASLNSYCHLRIRGAVLDELRRLDWVPRTVHEDAKKLEKAQEKLAALHGREPEEEEIRQELGLNVQEFSELLDRIKPISFLSLQEPAYNDDNGEALTHEEVIPDNKAENALGNLLRSEDHELLKEQLQLLPKQQLIVLSLYYYEGLRLREIAEVMDLTESRVSQIHALAVSRLKKFFEKQRKSP